MPNTRVYTLAKELGFESKLFVKELEKEGIKVKSHMSTVDDETVELIMTLFKIEQKPSPPKKSSKKAETPKKKETLKKTETSKKTESSEKVITEKPTENVHDKVKSDLKDEQIQTVEEEEFSSNDENFLVEEEEGLGVVSASSPVNKIKLGEVITVSELGEKLKVNSIGIIKYLMSKGEMATVNQSINFKTASTVCEFFQCEVELSKDLLEESLDQNDDNPEDMIDRAPVITVMGHVDHGKTRLLDSIRNANVMDNEAGGITQHIGAYRVATEKGTAVFIDTPGHEAFAAMRARGSQITDLVVLVVAANEGVMPQTREAVSHAKDAGVAIMVAINKMDLPDANPDRIKQQLAELNLIPEDWGGDTVFCPVSAKDGTGIEDLLDLAILQAEMLELKANAECFASGIVVEAKLDKGRGPVATVLVQRGKLNVGDHFVSGKWNGKVRALFDDKGKKCAQVGPSTPVEILGFSGVPEAGDALNVVEDERTAREISSRRSQRVRVTNLMNVKNVNLENFMNVVSEGEIKELNLILKADAQGSIEALRESLAKLGNEEVSVRVVHESVGGISETDVMLASASSSVVVGFNVRPTSGARDAAKKENIDIRLYSVIYDVIEEVKSAMSGILEPVKKEVEVGNVEVRELFRIPSAGVIAGCFVKEGSIKRGLKVRLIRDSVVVYSGDISSLKRFKDDVNEVKEGYECGVGIESFNDIKVGDIIEPYTIEEIARTL
ncbi:MAG: translation initiation factor IF-2 [Nitrospinota bacterium]|nr:translation initiation factor IF-2 [Nitrospinota bacterium]